MREREKQAQPLLPFCPLLCRMPVNNNHILLYSVTVQGYKRWQNRYISTQSPQRSTWRNKDQSDLTWAELSPFFFPFLGSKGLYGRGLISREEWLFLYTFPGTETSWRIATKADSLQFQPILTSLPVSLCYEHSNKNFEGLRTWCKTWGILGLRESGDYLNGHVLWHIFYLLSQWKKPQE